jgi:hypothetical protein
MWWILIVIAQCIIIGASIQDEQREGLWKWPRFFFVLGFAAFECTILMVPSISFSLQGDDKDRPHGLEISCPGRDLTELLNCQGSLPGTSSALLFQIW